MHASGQKGLQRIEAGIHQGDSANKTREHVTMAVNITPTGRSGKPPFEPGEALEALEALVKPPPPSASEPGPRHYSDAERVRALLRSVGLSVPAAARELEIDDFAMRGYCTGKPVPRYLILAIERIAELRRIKVYHITKAENAGGI